jgi:hypothetical protein
VKLRNESKRARAGASFRAAVNRLLRRGARPTPPASPPALPKLPGGPVLDLDDVSAVLAALDDERRTERRT